uniref:Deltamethrin resistance protein prag01 domain-containing protein n=4 Tax=Nyssorhynchus TaxID=44543 RepID=A0A2M4B0A7_9DIPT
MQAARPLSHLVARNAGVLSRAYHGPSNFRVYTMNDMPVPEGDFFEEHRRKNRVYNTVLAAGIVIFGITFTVAKESGLIFFNYNPPKSLD